MGKLKDISILILLLVIGFLAVNRGCVMKKRDRVILVLQDSLTAIKIAETTSDTVVITNYLTDTLKLRFTETLIDTFLLTDTVRLREYTGEYESDYLRVRWRALVWGTLENVEIMPASALFIPQITQRKLVFIPQKAPVDVRMYRSQLFLYTGVNYAQGLTGATFGMAWAHKRGWMFGGGLFLGFDNPKPGFSILVGYSLTK